MTTDNLPVNGDVPKKKKRGRPRKNLENTAPVKKKKRGRPRKVKEQNEMPEIVINTDSLPDTQTDVSVRPYEGNQEETAGIINDFDNAATKDEIIPFHELEKSPFLTENNLLAEIETEVDNAAIQEEAKVRAEVEGLIEEETDLTGADIEITEESTPLVSLNETQKENDDNSENSSKSLEEDFEKRVQEEVDKRLESEINQSLASRNFERQKLSVHERLQENNKVPVCSIKLSYRLANPRPVYKLTKSQILNMPFLISEEEIEDVMMACEDSYNVYIYNIKDMTCLMN
jgi:chemotaxis protein histidine kinase CheA